MSAKVDAILAAVDIKPDEEHLEQYGVKGMKWGVRKRDRDQKRVSVEDRVMKDGKPMDLIVTGSSRRAAKRNLQTVISRSEGVRRMTKEESEKYSPAKGKTPAAPKSGKLADNPKNRRMSDAELRSKLNRLQMEKQYKELTSSPKGKSFVRDVLEDTGKQVARQVVKTSANVALEMALRSLAKDAKAGSFVSEMAVQIAKKKK